MTNKKILHVVNVPFVLPYYLGDQIDFFKDQGYDIHIACSPSDEFINYSELKHFKAFPLVILRSINPIQDLKSIYKLRNYIQLHNIQTVIGHTPKGAMVGMMAAKWAKVPKRVYFRHGVMYETSTGIKRWILKTVERVTAFCANKIVNVSESVAKVSVLEKLNNPNKQLLLNKGTCNGIDIKRFMPNKSSQITVDLQHTLGIKDTDFVLGYVGRLVNDKGINELIDAWKLLLQKPNFNGKLLLVGPFETRDSISDDLKDYVTNEPSIIHTGLVKDVIPYYNLMNVFILPSYREGFPTVVLEASAMQIPIITTQKTGCIDSIIPNKTGIFTQLLPEDIVKNISYYYEHPLIAKEHGINGRDLVITNFDQHVIWEEIQQKIYNN